LSDRTFSIKINKYILNSYSIKAGVPQGAVLSPILFNLFASDLPRQEILLNNSRFSVYADDFATNNSAPIKKHYLARQKLQKSTDSIVNWANRWRIKLNPEKCNTIQFSKMIDKDILEELYYMPIQINNIDVPKIDSIKFLGLNFIDTVGWSHHLEKIINKVTPIINGLTLAKRKRIKPEIIVQIYVTYIKSIICYAAPAWSQLLNNTQKLLLERIQNKCIRIAYGLPPWSKVKELYNKTKLISLHETFKNLTLKYMERSRENEYLAAQLSRLEELTNINDRFEYPPPIT
jgi:hypothetical protein